MPLVLMLKRLCKNDPGFLVPMLQRRNAYTINRYLFCDYVLRAAAGAAARGVLERFYTTYPAAARISFDAFYFKKNY